MLHHLHLWLKAVLALVVVALLGPLLLSQAPATPKRYALVVGINEYEHADLATLKVAENDAKVLARELEQLGYQVICLGGKKATKAAIEKGLHDICEKARKSDLVLVALSGHGVQFEATDVACFCPVDAKPFKERAETLVSMATVYKELKSSFAGDKLLLIDACRNDPNVRGRSGIEAESAPVPFGVAALYACAPGQKAMEDDKLGHGLFMHAVLAGLRGGARDAETEDVNFSSLSRYVQKATPTQAARLPGSPRQTPTLEARYVAAPVLVPKGSVGIEVTPLKPPFGPNEIAAARTAWARKLGVPEKKTLDLGGGITLNVVLIPPGVFQMGSPETEKERSDDEKQHEVELTLPYYLAVTETTQAQYRAITGESPSQFKGDTLPVESVSWNDAAAFCEKLGTRVSAKVNLPTEAQWEYACRAGTSSAFHFGEVLNSDKANCDGKFPYGATKKGPYLKRTTAAGDAGYPANGFGLRDMHGNVWEWCQDAYRKDYEALGRINPLNVGQPDDSRVLCGGSWLDRARDCRAAARYHFAAPRFENNLGFRVALGLD